MPPRIKELDRTVEGLARMALSPAGQFPCSADHRLDSSTGQAYSQGE